jgi:hypothetical protein
VNKAKYACHDFGHIPRSELGDIGLRERIVIESGEGFKSTWELGSSGEVVETLGDGEWDG